MQNTTTTSSSDPSTSVRARAEDAAHKTTDRVQSAAEQALHVASDTAHKVRDQVQAAADRLGTDRVQQTVHNVVEGAKETLTQATAQGTQLLHDGRDAALDTYHAARDYAVDAAHDVSDRARRAGTRTVRYARAASVSTGQFVSVHALPLTVVGAGLGWLAWSIRREARRKSEFVDGSFSVETRPTYGNDYRRTPTAQRAQLRGNTSSRADFSDRDGAQYGEQDDPRLTNMDTSGNRLMGVRTGRIYEE